MRNLLIVLFTALTTFVYSQHQKLEIQAGAITIDLEEQWKVEENQGSYMIRFLPDKEHVNIITLSKENNSLNDIFSNYVSLMDEVYDNPKIIDEGTKNLNGITYQWISFDVKLYGQKIRFLSFFTVTELHAYDFIFSTPAKNISTYEPIFEDFLKQIDYGKPDIKVGEKLEKLFDKKWVLKSSFIDGFPDTNMKERNHYFRISADGSIRFFDKNDEILFQSLYTYNSDLNSIHFYRESRSSHLNIKSVTDTSASFSGVDYLKSKIMRTYEMKN